MREQITVVTKAYLDELLKDASAGDFMLIQNEINCLNEAMEIAHKKEDVHCV